MTARPLAGDRREAVAEPDEPEAPPGSPDLLEQALARVTAERRPLCLHLRGPAPARAELGSALRQSVAGRVWSLRSPCGGGCFNALGVGVDHLVDLLEHLAASEDVLPPLPAGAAALRVAFPAFARLPRFAALPTPPPASEPHELRRQAFEALRTLLVALSARRPVLLELDDIAAGDEDSRALLEVLLRDDELHEGEDFRLLVIAGYRGPEAETRGDAEAETRGDAEAETRGDAEAETRGDAEGEDAPERGDLGVLPWLARQRERADIELLELRVDEPAEALGAPPGDSLSAYLDADASASPPDLHAPDGIEEAIAAGDLAFSRLAFARATAAYRRALARFDERHPDAQHPNLMIKLGSAQAELGQRQDAARHLLVAAQMLGSAKTDARVRELELRAAALYIADGALDAAWRVLESLLRAFAVPIPGSAAEALVGANWRRSRLILRRRELGQLIDGPRSAGDSDLDEREQARLDTLWFISTRLTAISRSLADALRTRHLETIVREGGDSARARALAYEVAVESHIGAPFEKSAARLLRACAQLCARTEDPLDAAWHHSAIAAQEFTQGRWRRCAEACEAAEALLSDQPGVAWERATIASYHDFALAWQGELSSLRRRLTDAAALAVERDEPFALLEAFSGQSSLAWLAADRAELAHSHAAAALRRISPQPGATWPERSYRRQHYRDLIAQAHIGLYRGEPGEAWAALLAQWRELELAYFTTMRTVGLELSSARCRVALAVAERHQRDGQPSVARLRDRLRGKGTSPAARMPGRAPEPWSYARLIADARRQLEVLREDEACFAPGLAALAEAGLRNLEGESGAARRLLDEAVRSFSAVDMLLHRECARYALGELIGGPEGGAMQDRAETWMRGEAIVNPRRMAASQAPGFGLASG
ncbi:hypothetical protein G6O69_08165 [Pseudenhygromyxa sp. WMMC2535]|uniref:hypothetical protein n=1 Tax=Pseudenhygromyxa sp. WMMC2535 TaxID=2712867 RepID=UPI0015962551|nr:hypothetical protein [Pseudenhygromyxa sp. WMMC2535]NVB37805.1 hypothetical protein [Pseudenhygromyxa sp. WMMC2535]